MKVLEIAFTAYPVTDLKRARKFYETGLGLTATHVFGDESKAWVEYDIGSATLAIANIAPDWQPSPGGGSVALEVENLAQALDHVRSHGYSVSYGPMETPVCHLAVVSDPDGNSITLHKRK